MDNLEINIFLVFMVKCFLGFIHFSLNFFFTFRNNERNCRKKGYSGILKKKCNLAMK